MVRWTAEDVKVWEGQKNERAVTQEEKLILQKPLRQAGSGRLLWKDVYTGDVVGI